MKEEDIIEITGKATKIGNVKIKVQDLVQVEVKKSDKQKKAMKHVSGLLLLMRIRILSE